MLKTYLRNLFKLTQLALLYLGMAIFNHEIEIFFVVRVKLATCKKHREVLWPTFFGVNHRA